MKNKIIVMGFVVLMLLTLVFGISEENQTIITKQDALNAINDSEQVINQMQASNFSVNYMNDSLIEAKRVFEQARYASILRGDVNSTEKEKTEARAALRLVKWQDITYVDVFVYTNDIQKRKETAFLLYDRITVEENKLEGLSDDTKNIFEQAKIAFYEDRYNDAEKLLEEFRIAVEKEKQEASTLAGLKNGAMNFFQRYWIYILIIFILALIVSYFLYKKFERKILLGKIRKMKTEENVLDDLMKKTQTERFKENKISGLVYNIRMKKYEERLSEIKEELPVLEKNLTFLIKNKYTKK